MTRKQLKKWYFRSLHLSICFALSEITVAICHVRNPYLGFNDSPATMVLHACAALCLLTTVVLGVLRRSRRKKI